MDEAALCADRDIVDFKRGLSEAQMKKIQAVSIVASEKIATAYEAFYSYDKGTHGAQTASGYCPDECIVYEHKEFDGLRLFPSLLPPECQILLLNKLLHRDLSNPLHTTNLHNDYHIPFPKSSATSTPASFFTYPRSGKHQVYIPRDPVSSHKPLDTAQFLQKKLRWLTLGDQYDWTTRSYPSESPTPFPKDIGALVTSLFENSFTPESGVVLLYSPKDYMPVHRDVSEECTRGLASFSLGCDGLFIIARDKNHGEIESNEDREQEIVVIRVRSGDVIQMGGKTRWAWHAMPKVLAGTCPSWLEAWPATSHGGNKEFEKWRGYMKTKRLNISCRQVWSS